MLLWSATWKNTRVSPGDGNPQDSESNRSGSGAKVHFGGVKEKR